VFLAGYCSGCSFSGVALSVGVWRIGNWDVEILTLFGGLVVYGGPRSLDMWNCFICVVLLSFGKSSGKSSFLLFHSVCFLTKGSSYKLQSNKGLVLEESSFLLQVQKLPC
jgi:hypothetical protein